MPLGLKPESVQNYDVIHRVLEKKNIESRRKWQERYGNWFDESDAKFLEKIKNMKKDAGPLPADTYKYKPTLTHPFNPANLEEGLFKPNDFSIPKCPETTICPPSLVKKKQKIKMQPQVVRQLSSATPGKIIIVKEQEPRPIRSSSTHNTGEKWANAPAPGHSVSTRRKPTSSKQAHSRNTPKQAGKKKTRSGTPKKQRVPDQQHQTPVKQKKDTSLKDTLVTALLARMRTEAPIFGASVSRSVTPSGAQYVPPQSLFGNEAIENELIRKLKRAVIDTLHEEGISRHEDSPKTMRSSHTRDFGIETDKATGKASSRTNRAPKRGSSTAASTSAVATTVTIPNKQTEPRAGSKKKEQAHDPAFDDLRDDELYNEQLNELMENTYIPGTTVDEYTANQSVPDDLIDVTTLAERGAHTLNRYSTRVSQAAKTVQPLEEDYDGSESDQSLVAKELHNAVKMTTQLASLLPQGNKGGKNVSQMVTNLTTTINTILHAYKGDKGSPAMASASAPVQGRDQRMGRVPGHNEVSDTQDHVPSYKEVANARKFLEDAIFEYPELPERVVEKISRNVAMQISRDPNMTETVAKQLFQDEINNFLVRSAAAKGDNVGLALATSTLASSKVDRISAGGGRGTSGLIGRGLANEESAPSMTLPEQTELYYLQDDAGGRHHSPHQRRTHPQVMKSQSAFARAGSAGITSPGRSSSANDPTQMSLSDYTNIPPPKIEKIKPNTSYTSDTSMDYAIQRTGFDREIAREAEHPGSVQPSNLFAYAQEMHNDSFNPTKLSPQDAYLARDSTGFRNMQSPDPAPPAKSVPAITPPVYLPQQKGKASPPPTRKYEFDELSADGTSVPQGIEIATRPSIPDNYHFDDLDPSQLVNKKAVEIEAELNLGQVLQAEDPNDDYEQYMMQRDQISRNDFFDGSAGLNTVADQPFSQQNLIKRVIDDDTKDWDTQIDEQLDFVDDGSDSYGSEEHAKVVAIPEPPKAKTGESPLPQEVVSAAQNFGIDSSILDAPQQQQQYPVTDNGNTVVYDEPHTMPQAHVDKKEETYEDSLNVALDDLNQVSLDDTLQQQSPPQPVLQQHTSQVTTAGEATQDTAASVADAKDKNKEHLHPETLSAHQPDGLEPEPRQPILYEPDPNISLKEIEEYADVFCGLLTNPNSGKVSLEALIDVDDKTTHLSALFDACILALSNVGLSLTSQLSKAVITSCDALEADYLDNGGLYKFTLEASNDNLDVFLIQDRFRAALAGTYVQDEARLRTYLTQQLRIAANVQPSYTAAVSAGVKQTEHIFFDEMDAVTLSRQIADSIVDDLAAEVSYLFGM